jgi:2-keto-3-deoxy-L-rhamnonate aldolase RhmA
LANRVKEMLARGEPTVGHWLSFASPAVAELLASFGMDWLMLDTEHGPASYETLEDIIRAVRPTPAVPLVRVHDGQHSTIKKALDRGAMGVLVPLVESVEQARAIVAACKFPPEGTRGIAGTRAARFGLDLKAYVESWNRDVIVAVQIETRPGVEQVEAIAAVPGLDVLFIGPNDLSAGLGAFQQFDRPEYRDAVTRIKRAADAHRLATGYMALDAASTVQKVEEGFRFVAVGTDARLLAAAAQQTYGEIRRRLERR